MSLLDDDTTLDIRLSAILTRGKYTSDPAAVIAELHDAAGGRDELLVGTVGSWIGYFGDEEYVQPLVEGLRAEFSPAALQPGVALGRSRRGIGHTTPFMDRLS